MMAGAIEIHLPNLDEWKVVRNGKSLTLPDIFTVQYAGVLVSEQNFGFRNLRMRAAARDQRPRQNRENAERRDFHSSSPKWAIPCCASLAQLFWRIRASESSIATVERRVCTCIYERGGNQRSPCWLHCRHQRAVSK